MRLGRGGFGARHPKNGLRDLDPRGREERHDVFVNDVNRGGPKRPVANDSFALGIMLPADRRVDDPQHRDSRRLSSGDGIILHPLIDRLHDLVRLILTPHDGGGWKTGWRWYDCCSHYYELRPLEGK